MSGPLEGTRILSFGTQLAGNSVAMWLANLGAEVIKIESLKRPDGMRARLNVDHPKTLEASGAESTTTLLGTTRGVKSIGLDVKSPEGRAVFGQLVAKSDAVLENLSRGASTGLGLAYPRLCEDKADIIVLSIAGFGRTGPYRDFVAFGGNAASYSGFTRLRGLTHGGHADFIAGSLGGFALVTALYDRDRTGKGCWIDISQSEAIAALLGPYFIHELYSGEPATWTVTSSTPDTVAGVFRCMNADRWIAVEAQTVEQRQKLLTLIGAGEATIEPAEGIEAIRRLVAAWVADRDPWQSLVLLQRAGVPAGIVHDGASMWSDPQLRQRGFIEWTEHRDFGSIEYPANPYHFSRTPTGLPPLGPRLGQSTFDVLHDWLGFDESEVRRLIDSGVAWADGQPAATNA